MLRDIPRYVDVLCELLYLCEYSHLYESNILFIQSFFPGLSLYHESISSLTEKPDRADDVDEVIKG